MPNAAITLVRQSIIAVIVAASVPALAISQRTFVSGQGSDVAACSITAPCRSFAAAIAQTIVGGEVIVLDSAGYGPVTITQSVTITAPPGVYAGISVPLTTPNGVFVNAPSGTVLLRGLTINSTGGTYGIYFANGALTIERCRISGFQYAGIIQIAGVMTVRDTVISDGGPLSTGATVGTASATFDGVSVERTYFGVRAVGTLAMRASTISETMIGLQVLSGAIVALDGVTISSAAGGAGMTANNYTAGTSINVQIVRSQFVNSSYGISADGVAGSVSNVQLTDSLISNAAVAGVTTSGTALAALQGNTIVNNGIGLNSTNDNMYTLQNNQVFLNTTNISGLVSPISSK